MSNDREQPKRELIGLLGVGLDNKDGHQRLTRNEHFLLVGGSAETHERMQETSIKFSEALQRRGKELHEAQLREVLEIFHEIED